MAILRVAYLHLCKHCNQHGHINLPDGTSDNEVATKKDALWEVERLLEQHQIATDESIVLKAQIESSALADRDTLLSEMLRTGKEIDEAIKEHLLDALGETGEDDTPPTYH